MRTFFLCVGLACALSGLHSAAAQSPAASDPSATDGHRITLTGTLKNVTTGSRQAIFFGDDQRDYPLDLSHARIISPNGSQPQLLSGTRATVSGLLNFGGSITVSRLQVFPISKTVPTAVPATVADTAEPLDLTVRGTVESVNAEQGDFVLRVNTHTRVVFVTADTDLSGLDSAAADQFPVRPTQRVTVGGALQSNGTLLAGVLTQKEDIVYRTPPGMPNRIVIGTIASVAGKLRGRDIKLLNPDGTETSIQVPRGIPIRRGTRSISVHDLTTRDQVRVAGRLAGTDFRASRIDVLAPAADYATIPKAIEMPAAPPARPGL